MRTRGIWLPVDGFKMRGAAINKIIGLYVLSLPTAIPEKAPLMRKLVMNMLYAYKDV